MNDKIDVSNEIFIADVNIILDKLWCMYEVDETIFFWKATLSSKIEVVPNQVIRIKMVDKILALPLACQ